MCQCNLIGSIVNTITLYEFLNYIFKPLYRLVIVLFNRKMYSLMEYYLCNIVFIFLSVSVLKFCNTLTRLLALAPVASSVYVPSPPFPLSRD